MDGVGRLTKFQRPGGLADVKEQSWILDDANNWHNTTKKTGTGGATVETEERSHGVNNSLLKMGSTRLVYDANGNRNETPEFHYKWDFKNRLREVWTNATTTGLPSKIVAEYWYDAGEPYCGRKDTALPVTTIRPPVRSSKIPGCQGPTR